MDRKALEYIETIGGVKAIVDMCKRGSMSTNDAIKEIGLILKDLEVKL